MAELLNELLRLEHDGWRALCSGTAKSFYGARMTEDARVVVPGMVLDRAQTLASWPDGPAWQEYEIADAQVVVLGADAALLVYRAAARRADFRYEALISSGYVRRGGDWRLAFHQQTPLTK